MSRFWLWLAFAMLLACSPTDPPLRNPEAPLGATTRFDATGFAGSWQVVASSSPSLAGAVQVTDTPMGLRMTGALSGTYQAAMPAVFETPDGVRVVVMWVDEEHRTAALGTASGDKAVLLSRSIPVPVDKRAAAFDVFDFYGWDTTRIEERGT